MENLPDYGKDSRKMNTLDAIHSINEFAAYLEHSEIKVKVNNLGRRIYIINSPYAETIILK